MNATVKRWLPFALVAAASAVISLMITKMGDYPQDAAAAVDALAHGHLSASFAANPIMGQFSILLRAPFAALAGGGDLDIYRWGAFPCVMAAGLLGLHLARLAGRRGSSQPAQALLAGLCLINPLTLYALQQGHPEEILTAALAVGAVATASEGHLRRTALLLGLAIATKQWAVIAILPVLMALPARRVAVALGAGAIALALTIPAFLASPEGFYSSQGLAVSVGRVVSPFSTWYPSSSLTTHEVHLGAGTMVVHSHNVSAFVGRYAHGWIVLVAFLVPLALAVRRRRIGLSGADAMALLALLALLRCVLDPVDNIYYHAPLLLALAGWDAFAPSRLPVRLLLGTAVAALFWNWGSGDFDPAALNAAYLVAIGAAGAAIAFSLFRARDRSPSSAPARPGAPASGRLARTA